MEPLLYGKDKTERIVSIEVNDSHAEIFTQNPDGTVSSSFVDNRYWVLSRDVLSKNNKPLSGNLHYKFGYTFALKSDFLKYRSIWKKNKEDIYSIYNDKESHMVKTGRTYFKGLLPKDISILSFDMETTGLDGKAKDAKIILISTTYRDQNGIKKRLFRYDDYEFESHLIEAFCDHVRELNPSILLGHNVIQFDLKYLQDRADATRVELILGRDNSLLRFNPYSSTFRVDGNRDMEYNNCHIYGREIVDTYFLAQKFDIGKSFISYGLKSLIKELKMEDPNRTFYDASQIRFNYQNLEELKKIIAYCIDDSDDSIKIWDHMGSAMFYWCQKVPKAFQEVILSATGSQINSLMVRSYLQEAHSIPAASPTSKFRGAISYGKAGIYSNCVRWDVASLYPSIIIAFDVHDPEKDPKGNFLKIVKLLTEQRLKNKKLAKETGNKYYDDLQNSEKIGINSAYGFLAAPGLNFNCLEAADFITEKGREILNTAITWATSHKFETVAPGYFVTEEGEESVDE